MSSTEDYPDRPAATQTSGKAIASLVLGLGSFCLPVLAAIPAIILALLGLRDIGRSHGRITGQGLAIAGIVVSLLGSVVGLVLWVIVAVPALLVFGLSPVGKVQAAAERVKSQNNLRQIGLAMEQYHDKYNKLPMPAIYSPQGKPLLSWRVALLPYLEEEQLYRQFKLDEPWDSPHNKALLSQIPKVYASPKRDATGDPSRTYYQVFVGKREAVPGPRPIFTEGGPPLTLAAITNADGRSNTLLVVEAGDAVPWTKPDDLPYSPNEPLPKLGGLSKDGFNVVFADGSVRFLRTNIDEKTLRNLITYNDGEVLPANALD
jgi:prepilin-type processing-associated H-X9-DG protein